MCCDYMIWRWQMTLLVELLGEARSTQVSFFERACWNTSKERTHFRITNGYSLHKCSKRYPFSQNHHGNVKITQSSSGKLILETNFHGFWEGQSTFSGNDHLSPPTTDISWRWFSELPKVGCAIVPWRVSMFWLAMWHPNRSLFDGWSIWIVAQFGCFSFL